MEREIEEILKKADETFQKRQQLTVVGLGLDYLRRLSLFPDTPFREAGFERVGQSLLQGLPEDVTTLYVGAQAISRLPDTVEHIPEAERKQWTLMDVDQYGASIARSIGARWVHRFRPQKPSYLL